MVNDGDGGYGVGKMYKQLWGAKSPEEETKCSAEKPESPQSFMVEGYHNGIGTPRSEFGQKQSQENWIAEQTSVVAFLGALIGARHAYKNVEGVDNSWVDSWVARMGMVFFLANVGLLMRNLALRARGSGARGISEIAATVKTQEQWEPKKSKETVIVVVSLSAFYGLAQFWGVNRVSVLLSGLWSSPFNAYTVIVLVYDVFVHWNKREKIGFLGKYGILFLAFYMVRKKKDRGIIRPESQDGRILVIGAIIGLVAVLKGGLGGVEIIYSLINLFCFSGLELLVTSSGPRLISWGTFAVAQLSFIWEVFIEGRNISTAEFFIKAIIPFIVSADMTEQLEHKEDSDQVSWISMLKDIVNHSDTRAIFKFFVLNSLFMLVQFIYSIRSKSLGLLSDSLHMALDCSSLALGLVAGALLKREANPNSNFPFGFQYFEALAGLTNGSLLIAISGGIIFEAINRLGNPVDLENTHELLVVSILGLVVNLVGIFAFNHGHDHSHGHSHGHSHSHACSNIDMEEEKHHQGHSHSHTHNNSQAGDSNVHHMNDNMRGIFLHILADTLGSVGVVFSTLLSQFTGWHGFDPIASIIIAILIFLSVVPLIKSTSLSLLLKVEPRKEDSIKHVLSEVLRIKGVHSFTTPKFWPGGENANLCGYLHVQLLGSENSVYVKKQCKRIFSRENVDALIQLEHIQDQCWCRPDEKTKI